MGVLSLVQNYQAGQLHGLSFRYHSDGSISQITCYQNGVSRLDSLVVCRGLSGSGMDTILDLRDSIYLIYSYQNRNLHGIYTGYGSDGSIEEI